MMMEKSKKKKIEKLLKKRNKILKRLGRVDELFSEEKENEEAWPGHDTTVFQYRNIDAQVYEAQLKLVEKRLKKLGWKKIKSKESKN